MPITSNETANPNSDSVTTVRKLSSNAAIPDKFCGTIFPDDWKEKKGRYPFQGGSSTIDLPGICKDSRNGDRFSQVIPEYAAVAAAIGRSKPYSKIPFVGLREAGVLE